MKNKGNILATRQTAKHIAKLDIWNPGELQKQVPQKHSKKIKFETHTFKIVLVFTKSNAKLKKIPCILPIIHDNKFVTDFSKKVNLILLQNNAELLNITVFSHYPLSYYPIIHDQYSNVENVWWRYNWTCFYNIQQLLKHMEYFQVIGK